MASLSTRTGWRDSHPALRYTVPFAAILLFLAARPYLRLSPSIEWPLQVLILGALCIVCWPRELSKLPSHWAGSILVGLAVFLIWVGPDILIPGYRNHILFSNSLFGSPHSSIPPAAQKNAWVLTWRLIRATTVVPIAEELFWRGWLMRWLIENDFLSVRLGSYATFAFFATAVLFASEHGPYWDVGLITGIIYNLWMIKTRSVADCILMHAVTNGVLSGYVLLTANWQYWM